MANIQNLLNNIMKAVYGKDVRQSIHDAIKQCYYDGSAGVIDLAAREEIELNRNLIDRFTSLPAGSTAGNSELLGIREGYDENGSTKTYASAGSAVREQFKLARTVEVSDKEPTRPNVKVWINSKEKQSFTLPEVKDYDVNPEDTWSSEKLDSKISELFNEVFYVPEVRNYYNKALHTKDTISPHYYVDGRPYETDQFDSYYNATALFEIEPNVEYTIGIVPALEATSLPWYQASFGMFFYDESENFISSTKEGTFITPINAKYARFNYAKAYGIPLDRLNERCMLVKGDSLPDTYIPYEELVSVKTRVEAIFGKTAYPIAFKVEEDSIMLSAKYDGSRDIQYILKRKGGNNLFDFNVMYLFESSNNAPAIHDISGLTPFVSGGGDWHAPFQVAAVNNADGDQIDRNTYFTGGNHQYNNSGSGSTPTASAISLEFFADGLKLSVGDVGYARMVEMVWVNNVQGYNTTKADGTGREILQERHKMFFDGYEFSSHVELVPLEDVTCKLWYGFQIFNSDYQHIQYLDGSYRGVKPAGSDSESGDATTTIVRIYDDDGNTAEMEVDPNFDLGKRTNFSGNNSIFSASYGKTYCSIINKSTTLNEGCVYSLRGKYRFKSSIER